MARPREFDEDAVLDAAIQCFWNRGYEATSMKDLVGRAGISVASLYNAYGDKRALFRAALDTYVESSIGERIRRCEAAPPRQAIEAFFGEIVTRSLTDGDQKGCMIVNSALEMAPHDEEFRQVVADALGRIEGFFTRCIEAGQAHGTISRSLAAEALAQHFLAVLMGIRVLARARPERALLEGIAGSAIAMLGTTGAKRKARQ